jgi:crotonobetainyl-CoA:carnitine CoA-transferase CaiB-like acyl-CoA transferase
MASGQATGTSKANGLMNGHSSYSVPEEAYKVFHDNILSDDRIRKDLPNDIEKATDKVHFVGSSSPSLPVNWRFAEAVSSLKGLESSLINILADRKYSTGLHDVTIDTDHATLFIMSAGMWTIDPGEGGLNITAAKLRAPNAQLEKFFPSGDIHRSHTTLHRALTANIYRCKDGRFFSTHTDMNPDPTLDAIGLPHDIETSSYEEGAKRFQDAIAKIDSKELQRLCTDVYHQSGSVCLSVDEFNATDHGQANKQVGLWEIYDKPNSAQPAGWWPSVPSTSQHRPLAGLKVVDLTRVIAAPAVTRGLAELGASVMRCTAPHLPDVTGLHADLNWGKWNCSLDLRQPSDREKLKALVMDADVVVQGYRPGVLDKFGFGQQDIIEMCKDRERGIISARENCYGWHGPWKDRSGWQQISDAVCGASDGFGKAMGHGEPVQPIFPHSDYCTGISGTCAILVALLRRGEKGGSYAIDLALNYYTTWLVNSVGEYPREVFERVWGEHDNRVWHNWHANSVTGPETVKKLRAGIGGERLFKPEHFEDRSAPGILGKKKFRHIKSVAQWPSGTIEPGFRIGTRGNGVDAAHWPSDLTVEIVS